MPVIRLTEAARNSLFALAKEIVKCSAEEQAEKTAYDKVEPLVRAAVEAKYPVKDMCILKKYGAASQDDCIKLHLTAGGVDLFEFRKGAGPLVAAKTYSGVIYAADAATTDAFLVWRMARDKHKEARNAKLGDYSALIQASRTFEDVIAVWPEAAKLRPKSTALIILSGEVVSRIQKDVASRKSRDFSVNHPV